LADDVTDAAGSGHVRGLDFGHDGGSSSCALRSLLRPPISIVPRYYYGTVPALAWILNHYFYGRLHYSWLAADFCPLRTNPKSSNPYMIYGDLFWPWSRLDQHDKYVLQTRRSLVKGVVTRLPGGISDARLIRRLRRICNRGVLEWFYPVVYRVEIDRIDPVRRLSAGSATAGSDEYLVADLAEDEFELLFADNHGDPGFRRLVVDEVSGAARTSTAEALLVLERRLLPWVRP
jgi:hypothetical protein